MIVAIGLLGVGCASYQYRVVEPVELAGPIQRQEAIAFPWGPLEYHLVEARDELGILIVNLADEDVMLLGDRSYIVDPSGETHAMPSRSIAPHSRITMVLPPQPGYVYAPPRVSVGVGVGTGYRGAHVGTGVYNHRWAGYPYWSGYPRYVYVQDGGPYWRWKEGPVRMRLVYEQAGQRFEHNFAFERVRVR